MDVKEAVGCAGGAPRILADLAPGAAFISQRGYAGIHRFNLGAVSYDPDLEVKQPPLKILCSDTWWRKQGNQVC